MKKTISIFLMLAAVSLSAQERARRIDDSTLRAAGKTEAAAREWITYGGNYAETRFSPLKQIDTTNVKRLGLA